MRVLPIKLLCLSLLASVSLSGCLIVKKNTKICSVAGTMTAGMDCAYTLSDDTEEMDLKTSLEFLTAQPKRPDPLDPTKMLPERAGAICQSAEDWNADATTLEQACKKANCSNDVKQNLDEISRRLRKQQALSISKIPVPTKK